MVGIFSRPLLLRKRLLHLQYGIEDSEGIGVFFLDPTATGFEPMDQHGVIARVLGASLVEGVFQDREVDGH